MVLSFGSYLCTYISVINYYLYGLLDSLTTRICFSTAGTKIRRFSILTISKQINLLTYIWCYVYYESSEVPKLIKRDREASLFKLMQFIHFIM